MFDIKGKVNTAVCYATVVEDEAIEQIRRMCDALGYRVVSLKRVRIMNIRLGDLASGAYREITGEEKKELERLLGDSDSRPGGRERRPQRPEEQVETGKGKRIWRTRSNGSES